MQNRTAIIRIFAANTISGLAQGISMLAIPWYFADTLQDMVLFGKIYATTTLISLFWGLYAGTLIDKYNRKNLFLWETAFGAALLLSAAAFGFGLGNMPILLITAVFCGTLFIYNIHYPTLHAFMQEISAPQDYARVTSYLEIQGQVTTGIAAALGAWLLANLDDNSIWAICRPLGRAWTMQEIFLLDGITYLSSFALLLPLHYVPIAQRHAETISLRARFQIGIDFLRAHPLVNLFGNASYFVFVVTMTINFVMLPEFTRNYLNGGAQVYAIGDMFWSLGSAMAGALMGRLFVRNTVLGNIACTALAMCVLIALAFERNIPFYYVLMFLFGLSNAGARVLRVSYLFHHIPNQVIGRTSSIFMVVNVVLRLLFVYICSLPFFIHHIGWGFALLAAGCAVALCLLLANYNKLLDKPQ